MKIPTTIESLIHRFYNDKSLEHRDKIDLYRSYIKKIRVLAYNGNAEAQFRLGQHYEDVNYLGLNIGYDHKNASIGTKKRQIRATLSHVLH